MNNKNKKGIIFTLDAILAILLSMFFLSGTIIYLSTLDNSEQNLVNELNQLTLDSLIVLEYSGDLKNSITNNNISNITNFLNHLENNHCAKIYLYDSSINLLFEINKTGCSNVSLELIGVSRRSFVANNNIYVSKMEAWFS